MWDNVERSYPQRMDPELLLIRLLKVFFACILSIFLLRGTADLRSISGVLGACPSLLSSAAISTENRRHIAEANLVGVITAGYLSLHLHLSRRAARFIYLVLSSGTSPLLYEF